MPLFDYTGQLQSGQAFEGTLQADSQGRAETLLSNMGVRVTALRPARRTAYVAPLSLDDMLFFNEQLATMAKSSVPLDQGLRTLAADVGSRKLKRLLLDLSGELAAGTPLDQAIEKHRARFAARYADVVRTGLKTGDLGGVLYGLAAHLRLKTHFRRVLIELATYPLVVLAFSLVIATFFMHQVMPEVEDTVQDILGPLGNRPLPTMMQWTFGLAHYWYIVELVLGVLILGASVLVIVSYLPGGQPIREWLLRRIPGFCQVYWSSVLARFTHTSALGAYSGTPLPELIAAAGEASGSGALAAASRRLAEKLAQGQSLEAAAKDEPDVPPLWSCVVTTTAGRGDLPAALEELAHVYEARSEQWAGTVRVVLGPLLLLLLGVTLGGIIMVIFSTFANMINVLQSLSG